MPVREWAGQWSAGDQPFLLTLTLTLALQYGAVNEQRPFPATTMVDYVRARG